MPGMNLPETIERLNLAMPYDLGALALPTHFSPVVDATISGNTTLTEQLNIFNNLTISGAVTLTGLAGGTIIIVRENLVIDNASGVISVNALGAKPLGFGAISAGGAGGGAINFGTSAALTIEAFHARLQRIMASGGAGVNTNAVGGSGGAWSAASTANPLINGWATAAGLVELMLLRPSDDATYGGIGGGAGGEGADGVPAGTGGAGGTQGKAGANGSAATASGGGGSGFGGGGGGGGASGTSGTPGDGARGGGTLLIITKTINNAGTISANGANGPNASAAGQCGGGGGGGGGAVHVLYEFTAGSGVGTLQANAGLGGTNGGGTGSAGGAGGAGMATSARIRAGY